MRLVVRALWKGNAVQCRRWCMSDNKPSDQKPDRSTAENPGVEGAKVDCAAENVVETEAETKCEAKSLEEEAKALHEVPEGHVAFPSKEELWEKYGVLSEMDGRHANLTTQEYVDLWWKLQEFSKAGVTHDIWDIHTTQMQKDNWELTYQLFVNRLPPSIQELYRESFNSKYLSFRPPKVSSLTMPPPQDYLEVWQAEQPTFYIKETWPNPRTFNIRTKFWGTLRAMGVPVSLPKGGYAKIQLSHPITNDIPNLARAYEAKLQPGQLVKLLPTDNSGLPEPPRKRKFLFKLPVGNTPDYLSLKWAEIVAFRQGEEKEVQVKIFAKNSKTGSDLEGGLVPSDDYTLSWVPASKVLAGNDRLDYIPLGEPLAEAESRDIIKFLWPAPLSPVEVVKYHYSQDGYDYPWDVPTEPTRAAAFTADGLLLPYEFVSKREPDLPNTLGKISVVVGEREYPIMIDFWDALKRFDSSQRDILQRLAQVSALVGILFTMVWMFSHLLKYTLITRTLKPYNYAELTRHPRYRHIYGAQGVRNQDGGKGPWAYDRD
eukprot:TRINITY_DN46652_c0_g1_i1.p1 TRINITY_DN46652_c0_g1~~TRINITY_DN46652_c0_g1_i1.p1  ORF type:complete len:544 (+),score=126.94 TRINITY_DN46652_c0_g1_i1:34-1665(+)